MHQQLATPERCHQWLNDSVFHFRPKEHCEKYPQWPGMVGLEIEMLAYRNDSLQSTSPQLLPLRGTTSLSSILNKVTQKQGWHPEYLPDEENILFKIDLDDADQLTFEPGGQLEFSSKPYPCLTDAVERMEKVQGILDAQFAEDGCRLIQTGYNPWATADEVGLQMTKPRYRAMDRYFRTIGPYGPQMMRQTCTIQVNLDFGQSEEELAKRYLAANLVAPLATALFANSPLTKGKFNGDRTFRSRIWREIDDSRAGYPRLEHFHTIAQKLDKASCVAAYEESVMNAPVIFVEALDYQVPEKKIKFREWMKNGIDGVKPTMTDFKTHLSLHFLEVRPRGFLELRSIDCQSRVWQRVPAAFYTALLYDKKTTDILLDMILPYVDRLPQFLEKSTQGLQDKEIASLAEKVMELVSTGFNRLPVCFGGEVTSKALQTFSALFTQRKRTPADDIMDAAEKASGGVLTPAAFLALEDKWRSKLSE